METLEWSTSHAVFVNEMDDEHEEIFELLSKLETALENLAGRSETDRLLESLAERIDGHFAHEERLMRASRYGSFRWHKTKHDYARKRVRQLQSDMQAGQSGAGGALVDYVKSWLHEHTRLADMMLGAFLRNQRRVCRVTLRAGTKPMDACEWVDSHGEKFDPRMSSKGY